jgi:hypothetical protein
MPNRQAKAFLPCDLNELRTFFRVERKGFFDQDMFARVKRVTGYAVMQRIRHTNAHSLNGFARKQALIIFISVQDLVLLGADLEIRFVKIRNTVDIYRINARVFIDNLLSPIAHANNADIHLASVHNISKAL